MFTKLFTIKEPSLHGEEIRQAGELLRNGEVVAIPTETVYGLAANAFDSQAVKKIFVAKGRPQDNPLIVHIANTRELYDIAREVPQKALELAEKFWPGPLTIILPKKECIPDEVSGGLSTVAVRMPSHPVARAVISAAGVPLAAPSANISGFPSPTRAQYVIDDMNGSVSCIIDGGECEFGIESTVVTLATPVARLLRPGAVTHAQLEEVLGKVDIDPAVLEPLKKDAVASSPGMKYKHYSPNASITVVRGSLTDFLFYIATHKNQADYALCFEGEEDVIPLPCITMGKKELPLTQSHRLFDSFRELDKAGAKKVFARSPSQKGVGLGVCNRLYRAAGFKFSEDSPEDILSEEIKSKLMEIASFNGIIGICGGTGSGKSTLCLALEKMGCEIISADKIAREITAPKSEILLSLSKAFGEDILNEKGELNRAELARRAFADEEKTSLLNSLTHPVIAEICLSRAEKALSEGKTPVIDAPLLFSSGLNKICSHTVFVDAPKQVRINRIMLRDGISREAAEGRINAQKRELELCGKANTVLQNGGLQEKKDS